MPEPRASGNLDLRRCAGLGLELAGTVIAFSLLGYWLDRWLGTDPIFLIALALLGAAGGMLKTVVTVNALLKQGREAPRDDSRPDP